MKETTAKTSTCCIKTQKRHCGGPLHMVWGCLRESFVKWSQLKVKNLLQNVGWKHTLRGKSNMISRLSKGFIINIDLLFHYTYPFY